MKKAFLTFLLLAIGLSALAQDNEAQQAENNTEQEVQPALQHKVMMGETVMLICKKYVVAPEAIYELNPAAIDGITPGTVLSIPASDKKTGKQAKTKPEDTSITSHRAKNRTQ